MSDQIKIDPRRLFPNPWNTNHVPPDNERKLDESIKRLGFVRPVVVRVRQDGEYEILGGQHRVESAIRLGLQEIPAFNLGAVADDRAKEIGLVDNARYGTDDALALAELLQELGDSDALQSFLPIDDDEMKAIFAAADVDLDNLDLDPDDKPAEKPQKPPQTHQLMRYKVPVENADFIAAAIDGVIRSQKFSDVDAQVNAGDALTWIVKRALDEGVI